MPKTDSKTIMKTHSRPISKTKDKTSRKTGTRKKAKAVKVLPTVKPENMTLRNWQVALRRQMAAKERYAISAGDSPGEYRVSNASTRQEYKVVYRGVKSEWNYCSCMDFKTSRLGTCKHMEAVRRWISGSKRQKYVSGPTTRRNTVSWRPGSLTITTCCAPRPTPNWANCSSRPTALTTPSGSTRMPSTISWRRANAICVVECWNIIPTTTSMAWYVMPPFIPISVKGCASPSNGARWSSPMKWVWVRPSKP